MARIKTALTIGVCLALLMAASAQAGEVIVVDGNSATRVHDPAVPTRAEASIGLPPRVARAAAGSRARGSSKRTRRTVYRSLERQLGRGRISAAKQLKWKRSYVRSLRALRRLSGARDSQLRYVFDSVGTLARQGRLTPTRMPAAFLQLERNRQYWSALPYPASGDQVSFRGSQILFQYYPGHGLQIQPLSTFKKANALYGFCENEEPECDEHALRRILAEMTRLAVKRSRSFIAWEYLFAFGGGSPPWMSGMAQATAIQAYARASQLLGDRSYLTSARRALGAFETAPPTGVRTTGPGGGVHYLQYSFAPRLYIFNAFLQSLIGLWDYSKISSSTRALELFRQAEPEAEKEVPLSDVGDWSRYSYAGAESTAEYHELLREFLGSMCSRRLGAEYCDYAERYRGYQVDPPVLTYEGPEFAVEEQTAAIRFTVSKLSAVQIDVTRRGRRVFSRVATFRRGAGSFAWRPRGPGVFRVRLAAKELRTGLSKRDYATGEIEVENVPGR
jgi:D-glucuronyl C5-epimerase C-terminus